MNNSSPQIVVARLLAISGCEDMEDLLRFAATLSSTPGSVGNTDFDVQAGKAALSRKEVPAALKWWYEMVAPRVEEDGQTLAAAE